MVKARDIVPVDIVHKRVYVGGGFGAVVDVVGVLVHIQMPK